MMEKERNLGVTEARFALTLLTCLLVAIGYVALLRLGASKETVVEPGAEDVGVMQHDPPAQVESEPGFRVVPVEKADDGIKRADRSDNKRR
jgi:hypothetical protein